ncbi:class I SAM-dependent methyltransferase [Treponema primitia]|uniref:class I SAM-dependent methyltransferase n=1 Tax=Treponema primitia TaxID=88058 RepID=UPI00025558EE|nr:class I SAM-dependent methyltransferase [Treponema primitia]
MPEWFEDIHFWENYGPIMFDRKRWDEVPLVADGVTGIARLDLYNNTADPGGPKVLDLCCGFGRIALELARRGFSVTGVDITETYLNTGREDAAYEKLDIEFIQQDVRVFKQPNAFDLALNLYISFGYFDDPKDDLLFAKNARESLKPGGSFIIETLGKEIAVRDFVETEWFERAGYTVLTEYAPVDSWAGLKNRWILIKNGERIEKTFIQRLYSAAELRQLLFDAGFRAVELYGSWEEAPYDHRAEMLIAVGRK